MIIIKSDGQESIYDPEKVRRSMINAGTAPEIVEEVMMKIQDKLYERMTTQALYELVRKELAKKDVRFASRYNLRDGILKLGPAGFTFEQYVAAILRSYGWNAYLPQEELEGSCVRHEVDIVAEKDNRRIFIEAKFRNNFQDVVNLKDIMATWSRFLDLVDAADIGKGPHFDEPWIVTNARFTDRAKQFGACKGINLIGWDYPRDYTFANMVDHMALYPITVLENLKPSEIDAFSKRGLMLCRDIARQDDDELSERVGISSDRAQELITLCGRVIETPPHQK